MKWLKYAWKHILLVVGISSAAGYYTFKSDIIEGKYNVGSKIAFIGDMGEGTDTQKMVAKHLVDADQVRVVGDVIYPSGIKSSKDKNLFSKFIDIYSPLKKEFYVVLGNHDYLSNPDAWLDVSEEHSWVVVPSLFWLEKANGLCIVNLDTDPIERGQKKRYQEQVDWIKTIDLRGCDFVLGMGHHPYWSAGEHGDANGDWQDFFEEYLAGKLDAYIAGHDHNLSYEGAYKGTHLLVSGSGAKLRTIENKRVYAEAKLGFVLMTYLEKGKSLFEFKVIDSDGYKTDFSLTVDAKKKEEPKLPPEKKESSKVGEKVAKSTKHCTFDKNLNEASGLAYSKVTDKFYIIEDSGNPARVYKFGSNCKLEVEIKLPKNQDFEGIAVGPCGDKSCVYVGDIGDNGVNRDSVKVYKFSEDDTSKAEVIELEYEDGATNAEGIAVDDNGTIFISSKNYDGDKSYIYKEEKGILKKFATFDPKELGVKKEQSWIGSLSYSEGAFSVITVGGHIWTYEGNWVKYDYKHLGQEEAMEQINENLFYYMTEGSSELWKMELIQEKKDDIQVNNSKIKPNMKALFHYESGITFPANKFDLVFLDGWDHKKEQVQQLKEQGKVVVAYISVGNWEEWRVDKEQWRDCKGEPNKDWPGEYWVKAPCDNAVKVNSKRMDMVKGKGFDAVYFDNTDIYNNWKKITKSNTKDYISKLVDYGHSIGLLVGINNGMEMIDSLKELDFFVNESCNRYQECKWYDSFAGIKPIFRMEYRPQDCYPVKGHSIGLYSQKKLRYENFEGFCDG